MHLSSVLILAGALAVTAHPSGHIHGHAHDKRAPVFYKAIHTVTTIVTVEPPTTTSTTSTPPPPPPTTTSTSIVVPTTSVSTPSASASASSGSGAYKPFCGGTSKRATAQEIAYVGNTGSTYGCNVMEVSADIADQYDYTLTLTNVDSQSYGLVCFNKIGNDGQIDGFFQGKGESVVTTVAAGATTVIAMEANSQGACAFAPGSSVPTTHDGEYAGVWIEFDMSNTSNGGWSGADCSSLVSAAVGMTIPGCQVCFDGTCSSITPGGAGTNAFVAGTANDDGLGINTNLAKVALTAKIGYSG